MKRPFALKKPDEIMNVLVASLVWIMLPLIWTPLAVVFGALLGAHYAAVVMRVGVSSLEVDGRGMTKLDAYEQRSAK